MKWAVLVLSAAVTAGALHLDSSDVSQEEWNNYKLRHNKRYSSAEEERERMKTYAENKLMVEQHNEQYERGLRTFTLGLNQFSDRFQEEREHSVLSSSNNTGEPYEVLDDVAQDSKFIGLEVIPDQMDWRKRGAVTHVKNQGNCGDGWAFGTTGALEGFYAIGTGYLVSLSEQNLIDCCGDNGCGLHSPRRAFKYVHDHGIQTENQYPYTGKMGQCRFDPNYSIMSIQKFVQVPASNETALKRAVALRGPILAGVYAKGVSFQAYQGGVYYDKEGCKNSELTDIVLVVGYGTETVQTRGGKYNVDYWLIKNSWGTGWGINGYMKLARNLGNHCNIANYAFYPVSG